MSCPRCAEHAATISMLLTVIGAENPDLPLGGGGGEEGPPRSDKPVSECPHEPGIMHESGENPRKPELFACASCGKGSETLQDCARCERPGCAACQTTFRAYNRLYAICWPCYEYNEWVDESRAGYFRSDTGNKAADTK